MESDTILGSNETGCRPMVRKAGAASVPHYLAPQLSTSSVNRDYILQSGPSLVSDSRIAKKKSDAVDDLGEVVGRALCFLDDSVICALPRTLTRSSTWTAGEINSAGRRPCIHNRKRLQKGAKVPKRSRVPTSQVRKSRARHARIEHQRCTPIPVAGQIGDKLVAHGPEFRSQ